MNIQYPENFSCPICRAEMGINEKLDGLECTEQCTNPFKKSVNGKGGN